MEEKNNIAYQVSKYTYFLYVTFNLDLNYYTDRVFQGKEEIGEEMG